VSQLTHRETERAPDSDHRRSRDQTGASDEKTRPRVGARLRDDRRRNRCFLPQRHVHRRLRYRQLL